MFRGKLKLNKCEQPEKTSYTIHNPHSDRPPLEIPYYQITSIDPAAKNLGFRVERLHMDKRCEPLVFLRQDLQHLPSISDDMTCYLYRNLTEFLDQYLTELRESHLIVVERQLPENYRAVRISQHIISYLCLKLKDTPTRPLIFEVEARCKYTMLGAPSTLITRVLKKEWGPQKAREILLEGDDKISIATMNKIKKVDDLADTVLLRRVLELILHL